jgi:anti-sigma-K factor RskA
MPANVRHPSPELIDRLAAEYVLGTLRGPARDRFERWIADMPAVAPIVRQWEDRLVGLVATTPAIVPPASVWSQLQVRLGIRVARSGSWNRAGVRAIAAGLVVIGIALATFLAVREPPISWQPAATLAQQGEAAAWRVELSADRQSLRAIAERPPTAASGKSFELWALPADGSAPVSLGLLPVAGATSVSLSAAQRIALAASEQVAVSVEPFGGSPTGAPTGDVVIVAPLASGA